jgi:hypothetical protein
MTDETTITVPAHNETAGPLALPNGQHWPAGWVSPESFEHAQRQAVAWEIAQEEAAAAKAAREQAITERIASRRNPVSK